MANIHSLLPLLDDESWRWDRANISDTQMRPGTSRQLISSPKYSGFVYFGVISVLGQSGPKAEVEVEFDNANTQRSLGRLYNSGLTNTQGISPGISRFDTENDVYVTKLTPTPPIGYLDNAKIAIHSPQDDQIQVRAFGIKIDILDVDLFRESYQRITSGKLVEKMSNIENKLTRLNTNIEALGETLDADTRTQGRRSQPEDEDDSDSFEEKLDNLTGDLDGISGG